MTSKFAKFTYLSVFFILFITFFPLFFTFFLQILCTLDMVCSSKFSPWKLFELSLQEFKDTLKYIRSIRQRAEPYGICRIVPPASWNPPCSLKEKNIWENAKFATRIQRVDKLQNRISAKRMFRYCNSLNRKRRRSKIGMDCITSNGNNAVINELGYHTVGERFGFEPGPEFTIEGFQKYADDFEEQYFCMKDMDSDIKSNQGEFQKRREPTLENIEGEYWRMVEKPTEEIEVHQKSSKTITMK